MLQEKPYIGVTGVATTEQALRTAQAFKDSPFNNPSSAHKGMVGYLINHDILVGKRNPTRRHPSPQALHGLLEITHTSADNALHFFTQYPETLADQVTCLLKTDEIYDQGLARTVQFNATWPNPNHLKEIKDSFPDLNIIVQLGPRALRNGDTKEILSRIDWYRETMDYALIDPSGGTGTEISPEEYQGLFERIRSAFPELPIILAGGITPENMKRIIETISKFANLEDFGIDAQSGLMTEDPQTQSKQVNAEKVQLYLQQAATIFSSSS